MASKTIAIDVRIYQMDERGVIVGSYGHRATVAEERLGMVADPRGVAARAVEFVAKELSRAAPADTPAAQPVDPAPVKATATKTPAAAGGRRKRKG